MTIGNIDGSVRRLHKDSEAGHLRDERKHDDLYQIYSLLAEFNILGEWSVVGNICIEMQGGPASVLFLLFRNGYDDMPESGRLVILRLHSLHFTREQSEPDKECSDAGTGLDTCRDSDPGGLQSVPRLPGPRPHIHPGPPHPPRPRHLPHLLLRLLRLHQRAALSHLHLLLDPGDSLPPPAPDRADHLQPSERGLSSIAAAESSIQFISKIATVFSPSQLGVILYSQLGNSILRETHCEGVPGGGGQHGGGHEELHESRLQGSHRDMERPAT